jgi:hypothetical protein
MLSVKVNQYSYLPITFCFANVLVPNASTNVITAGNPFELEILDEKIIYIPINKYSEKQALPSGIAATPKATATFK